MLPRALSFGVFGKKCFPNAEKPNRRMGRNTGRLDGLDGRPTAVHAAGPKVIYFSLSLPENCFLPIPTMTLAGDGDMFRL